MDFSPKKSKIQNRWERVYGDVEMITGTNHPRHTQIGDCVKSDSDPSYSVTSSFLNFKVKEILNERNTFNYLSSSLTSRLHKR